MSGFDGLPILLCYLEKGIVPNWWQGIHDQLLPGIINRLFAIFNICNKSANSRTCQFYHYAFPGLKLTKFKIDEFAWEILTMAHWIRLSLVCRCKWTRKSQVSYEHVSEQYLLLFCEHYNVYCVYRGNLWSSIFVYGVLSLSMEFYLCLRSSIFVCSCWVHVYGYYWLHVCGFWVRVYGAIGCMPDSM